MGVAVVPIINCTTVCNVKMSPFSSLGMSRIYYFPLRPVADEIKLIIKQRLYGGGNYEIIL